LEQQRKKKGKSKSNLVKQTKVSKARRFWQKESWFTRRTNHDWEKNQGGKYPRQKGTIGQKGGRNGIPEKKEAQSSKLIVRFRSGRGK